MAPILMLIRHSQTKVEPDISSHEWELSVEGQRRCRHFVPTLAQFQPTRLISSQERKAIHTAEIVADALNLPCNSFPGLGETARATAPWYDDVASFQSAVQKLLQNQTKIVFGEESGVDALRRFDQAITRLLALYPNDRLGVVTHGTVMSLFVAKYNEIQISEFWESLTMPAAIALSLPDFNIIHTTLYSP